MKEDAHNLLDFVEAIYEYVSVLTEKCDSYMARRKKPTGHSVPTSDQTDLRLPAALAGLVRSALRRIRMEPTAEEWERALVNGDDTILQRLIDSTDPVYALHQVDRHLRQVHMMVELQPGRLDPDTAARRIGRLAAKLPGLRAKLGGWQEERDYDLNTLQWIRRQAALSVVLGAGATIAARGPSWPDLVKRLLAWAIERGRDILANRQLPEGDPRITRLAPEAADEARRIRDEIEKKQKEDKEEEIDTERLKEGAQICADLFGESLFQLITVILYPAAKRDPSPVHRAIAGLAAETIDGLPGLLSVITYNFDSLMNVALTEKSVTFRYSFMANRRIETSPGPERSMRVIHLHGFTPRDSFFNIKGIDFVFSTRQFAELYGVGERTIVDEAVDNYIRHPARVALYVGCSFADKTMNEILASSARRFPGRPHFALLRVPKEFRKRRDFKILKEATDDYSNIGLQPIWYEDHNEIPGLLDRLA